MISEVRVGRERPWCGTGLFDTVSFGRLYRHWLTFSSSKIEVRSKFGAPANVLPGAVV